jgi:hypothetical protein
MHPAGRLPAGGETMTEEIDHYARVCRLLESYGGVQFVVRLEPSATAYNIRKFRLMPDCGSNKKPAPCHVYVYPPRIHGPYRIGGSVEVHTFGAPTRSSHGQYAPWVEVKVYAIDLEAFDAAALERAAECVAALWRAFRAAYP